jgi:tetratricopeptide (TPR) repeat protein
VSDDTLEAERALARAESLLQVRRPEDALRELAGAAVAEPDNADVLYLMAVAYDRMDRTEDALRAAERTLALDPEYVQAYRLGCDVLLDLGRPDEALNAARRAVELEPDDAWSAWSLVRALVGQNDFSAAGQAAARVRELAPDSMLGWHAVGWVALQRNDWAIAEGAYRKALEISPDNDSLLNNLGLAVMRQGRSAEASQLFTRAGQLEPTRDLYTHNVTRSAWRKVLIGTHTDQFVGRMSVRLTHADQAMRRAGFGQHGAPGESEYSATVLFAVVVLQLVAVLTPIGLIFDHPFVILAVWLASLSAIVAVRYWRLPGLERRAVASDRRRISSGLRASVATMWREDRAGLVKIVATVVATIGVLLLLLYVT